MPEGEKKIGGGGAVVISEHNLESLQTKKLHPRQYVR